MGVACNIKRVLFQAVEFFVHDIILIRILYTYISFFVKLKYTLEGYFYLPNGFYADIIIAMDYEKIEPTLLYSVLCDDIRREDNGKFMLIGLFETIGAAVFPVVHPKLFIINCWCSGIGNFSQKTRITAPGNIKMIEDEDTAFTLKDLKSKHRVVARYNNLRFEQPGEYSVEVLLNGELKVRYPLIVEKCLAPK
jgi:hypothetical protein